MPEIPGEESTRIIPEYFLFFLQMELDSFIPDSDSVSDPNTRAKIISSKGRAISEHPAAEFGPVGVGDIVKVYLPYQNSYNGAKVLGVSVRNNLEPIVVEPDPSQFFGTPLGAALALGNRFVAGYNPARATSHAATTPEEITVFSPTVRATRLPGVDVSNYQPPETLNWDILKEEGIRWAIIKATEGATLMDASVEGHAAQLVSNNVRFSYYHFARPDLGSRDPMVDAEGEVAFFLSTIESLPTPTLPLVLDMEKDATHLTRPQMADWMLHFLSRIKDASPGPPIIYVGSNFMRNIVAVNSLPAAKKDEFLQYPLWQPRYPVQSRRNFIEGPNRVAPPWEDAGPAKTGKDADWTIYQFTGTGRLRGTPNQIDINVAKPSLFTLNSRSVARVIPAAT
jgi:GH25 family lysozyme M1 (1,4-beta-N-acetylmuramidase)